MEEVRAALETLRDLPDAELDRLCRRHHVRVLTVFGSATDLSVAAPQDLDIGIVFEPGSDHDVLGLLETLVATLGTERLDLLDAERASETARYRAIAEGEPLYESEPTAFANAYAAAVMLYLDTARFRHEALAHPRP
jgi:predicted nucleotidyltransferase